MAMVYGIVKRAEGHLWVDSAPGYGTTVTVLLPSHDPVAAPEEEVETVAARGRETVLLVEDDEAVRTLVHGWLTAHGYSVLEAEHPEVALGIAARNTAPIDLLLTDVVMPGMNGRRLADRILEMRPLIRVVYMSGYLDDVVLRSGVDGSGGPLLEKPFTAPELLRTLRAALAMPTEPAGAAAGRGW
jgi:CheY-like chemotaxis protein